ncbi:MAG: aldehyde dehydrogenase family protein [Pseudomonadota bacterium]
MSLDVDPIAETGCFIDGGWRPAVSGQTIDVNCPSDGAVFATIAAGDAPDVDLAVAAARRAFEEGAWSQLSAVERGRLLTALGAKIEGAAARLTQLEAQDTGKPLAQAAADITAAARYFEFYGGAADKLHGETLPFLPGYAVQTVREPHGVTGHIIPWNYPAQMFGRTLAPALATGNAVVLKPAEDACLTPLALAGLAAEVGFPPGAINVVPGLGTAAGAALTAHGDVDFLSFTGSAGVGVQVQTAAAQNHIACTLELGGKSPQILFDDADLAAALPVLAGAIVQNGGQTCSAGSRALIQRGLWDRVIPALVARFGALVAAPHDADADLGALISARQKARVLGYLDRAGGADAPILATGQIAPDAPATGHYVAPTLIGPVAPDHVLAQEEVFGPVLVCIPFEDEAEAIRIANATPYGLVAGIWSADGGRLMRMAKAMRCGQVFLNGYGAGGGIELPFGGVRKSGHGREKGLAALQEFTRLKTIVHRHG